MADLDIAWMQKNSTFTDFISSVSAVNFTTKAACENITTTIVTPTEKAGMDDYYQQYRVIMDVFVVGAMCLIGFIGNAMSIAVLYRDQDKKNTTSWLLQTLAVVDTLYLMSCFLYQTVNTVCTFTEWIPQLKETFPWALPYVWAIASIAQTITVWTVLLVTLDRYIAICMPLKVHLRSLERAKLAVIIVVLSAIVYNIPRFFEREVVVQELSGCNTLRLIKVIKTKFRKDKLYFLIYKTIAFLIFRTIGPLSILITLNTKLILALRTIRKKHKDLTRGRKHSENITLMLVVVVTVSIICMLPDLCLRIAVNIYEFQSGNNKAANAQTPIISVVKMRYASAVTNMLLTLNSSINFLIYCLVGKKFRRILLDMYGCVKPQQTNAMEISETEPLTVRTNVTKNGVNYLGKEGDVRL